MYNNKQFVKIEVGECRGAIGYVDFWLGVNI